MYLTQSVKKLASRARPPLAVLALACLVAATPASCHPGQAGQVTLQIGQCVLDDGILEQVFAALGQPDFEQEVEGLALKDAPDLVDCALHAIAAQSSGAGAGSGSSSGAGSASLSASAQALPIQVARAREVLAHRTRGSGAPGGGR